MDTLLSIKPLIAILLLTGCSVADNTEAVNPIILKPDYMELAYQFHGMDETTNRDEIKDFTGVDPVRTEWCAAFVNAVLNESDIKGSESVSNYPLTARSQLSFDCSQFFKMG